ncbi:MAG: YceI family protein [Alphaproteobacteria bacterium]
MKSQLLAAVAAIVLASPVLAQAPAMPGQPEAARVAAGSYKVDTNHTQVVWSVDHMGFSTLYGMVGEMTGTLTLDPANLSAASLSIDIPLSGLTVTSEGFGQHLASADFFEVEKFPTAKFVSTSVVANGNEAKITGDLTLHGVTKLVVLDAKLMGAGVNPMNKAQTVGFTATSTLKRSDFGLGYAAPVVSDEVELKITAAFELAAS